MPGIVGGASLLDGASAGFSGDLGVPAGIGSGYSGIFGVSIGVRFSSLGRSDGLNSGAGVYRGASSRLGGVMGCVDGRGM